ncbi:hypothetical protein N658DRAFT_475153 [Parathielavia hyrcaniae]|uniref:Uncharacterized protein n=1 Tax=Parathielavia hyrcaniae TaxID=113614 RepID=A0AAN6Q0E3_9PEZI|nr:hypothetical protein N658DRAFT_475153 [Parathielavia hyrcaniae]
MAAALQDRIALLSQAAIQLQRVVNDQLESVQLLTEADVFLDVEQLTGINMQEATEQLRVDRGILEDLYAQLDWALNLWSRTAADGDEQELRPKPQHDDPPPPQPFIEEPPSRVSRHCRPPAIINDPSVGSRMRHRQRWEEWTHAATIHDPSILDLSRPTRWWMQEQTQYGLCQPGEQDQLEHAARAAQFNRVHAPVPPSRSVAQEKNLRPGNPWTNPPRSRIPEEDAMSPRTVPRV